VDRTLSIDTLDFTAFGFTDMTDLTITQIGADTEIRVNDREAVLLQNTDVADIDATDFLF
jgi:hypothetical protein